MKNMKNTIYLHNLKLYKFRIYIIFEWDKPIKI